MMIDRSYMTKMMIVISSTHTTRGEMETISFFSFFTGFESVLSGFSSDLYALGWLTKPLVYLGSLIQRYTLHLNRN